AAACTPTPRGAVSCPDTRADRRFSRAAKLSSCAARPRRLVPAAPHPTAVQGVADPQRVRVQRRILRFVHHSCRADHLRWAAEPRSGGALAIFCPLRDAARFLPVVLPDYLRAAAGAVPQRPPRAVPAARVWSHVHVLRAL